MSPQRCTAVDDSLAEKLSSQLRETNTGCLEWTGWRLPRGGYGRIWANGRHVLAHRLAWNLWRGPIDDGLFVLHRCDNPPCCNPEHLFLGTLEENNADRDAKGRGWQVQRTHCPQGHPYSAANTYVPPSGRERQCRTCRASRRKGRQS